jgi:phosphoglycolate phosphatase
MRIDAATRFGEQVRPGLSMPYSLAIFDLDGTLADSLPWFRQVLNEVAREFDFRPLTPDEIEQMRRSSSRDILKRLDVPLWKVPRIATHMRAMKRQALRDIPLFAGVPDMLRTLAQDGIRLALVSSDNEANTRLQLGDSARLISDYACGASLFGKAAKFKRVVKRAGVAPSQAIAIGDEMRDLEAARAAGIAFGGVAWGYAEPEALRTLGPEEWFDAVADIPRKLAAKK